jgi:peptide/nickel transport system permease protein
MSDLAIRGTRRGSRFTQSLIYRGITGSVWGWVGMTLVVLVVGIALLGPLVAPHGEGDVVGAPFAGPSADYPLGTDMLGRDVLSRYLHGGRTLLWIALLATSLTYVVGIAFGLASGFRRSGFDFATVAGADIILSFPPIIFILTVLGVLGSRLSIIAIAIAITQVPRVIRITRAVTIELMTQEFVEAAIARGEKPRSVLLREVLPNIWTPVMADFGIRLTGAIILFSSIAYLGFGPAAPAADWGLMISENRIGLTIQPWVTVVPAVTIALLAIGVNMVADAIARAAGRSIT